MKIERLLRIIRILNNRGRVTSKELSEILEVSIKTVIRDIETIEMSGIPIVSYKGHKGGYEIIEGYKIDKTSMTSKEGIILKSLLEGIDLTYKNKEVISLIEKFEMIDLKSNENNFIMDFSKWSKSNIDNENIDILDGAISSRNYISFDYRNTSLESTKRVVEPYKIIYKALNWYLYGFCTLKKEMRIFKCIRIKNLEVLEEIFIPREIDRKNIFNDDLKTLEIVLKGRSEIREVLKETLPFNKVIKESDEFIVISSNIPYNTWVISMILGFGGKVEVLEPKFLREKIEKEIEVMKNIYK